MTGRRSVVPCASPLLMTSTRLVWLAVPLFAALLATAVQAEDAAVFKLAMRDGKFEPLVLQVPAGTRFRLQVANEGRKAMEFESKDLKQEKVIAPGKSATISINALKPGEYRFFDEFNPAAGEGRIVAK